MHNACQSQDGGLLEDLFAVCPETWVALDNLQFGHIFCKSMAKMHKCFPSATRPLLEFFGMHIHWDSGDQGLYDLVRSWCWLGSCNNFVIVIKIFLINVFISLWF